VASPLLANVNLNRLDQAWQMHHRRLGELTRYADDLVILCATKQRADAALVTLRSLLAELGLELAAAKSRIVELRIARRASIPRLPLPDHAHATEPVPDVRGVLAIRGPPSRWPQIRWEFAERST